MPKLLASAPRTGGGVQALLTAQAEIEGALEPADARALAEHVEKVAAGATALAELAALENDPALGGLLEKARAAGDPDQLLANLDDLYDRTGTRSSIVKELRPAATGEEWGPAERDALQRKLGPALLAEVAGTAPGDQLREFYARHELKLFVLEWASGIARYDAERGLEFNEKNILSWARLRGRKPADLLVEPAFSELTMLLATTFVHEATHHVQYEWARSQGLPDWSGQHIELEATTSEGICLLQKARASPRYRAFLEANAEDSAAIVAADLERARLLYRDPRAFRREALALCPDGPSLEGRAQGEIVSWDACVEAARAELARRSKLIRPEQARLEAEGGDEISRGVGNAVWLAELRALKTPALRRQLDSMVGAQAYVARVYAAYQERLDRSDAMRASAVKDLRKHRRGAAEPVPVPGGRR
ncbi:MAG: hypothetical protein HY554_04735 [Elusimicrobia bacterium]|nr:hypothetical protein [Elusimicrobiota bacterium]